MKKIINLIIMFLILYITLQVLIHSDAVVQSVIFSIDIFKNSVFPSLFPFLVLSSLLINYGFVELCAKLFKPIMNHLFKMNENAAFVFVMSLLSGFPSNSKYTKELYLKGILAEDEASKILMFTHFSNPLFILGTVGIFLNNKKIALLVLFCHYITNVIIGLIFRRLTPSKDSSVKFDRKPLSFGNALREATTNAINTLLLILGTITVFLVLSTIINKQFSLPPFIQTMISGLLEMTQGLKYTSLLNIDLRTKATLMTMFLSFGGLSVHMQVLSIISDTKIKYMPFFIARLIHMAISGVLVFLLYSFI